MTGEILPSQMRQEANSLKHKPCCGETDAGGICLAPACTYGEVQKLLYRGAQDIERLQALIPQWQPIETAPKDGTEVLVTNAQSGAASVVLWNDGDPMVGWMSLDGPIYDMYFFSHWMPLPEPPET